MKTVLLTTIFLMSIHTALSTYICTEPLTTCAETVVPNKIASDKIQQTIDCLSLKLKSFYDNLNKEYNALICDLKKISEQNEQASAQYCASASRSSEKIKCQSISNVCCK